MKIFSYGIPIEPYTETPGLRPPAMQDGDRWYCPVCNGDLFGVFHDGSLHIKYKGRRAVVDGIVTVDCRFCGVSSRIDTRYSPVTLEATMQEETGEAEETTETRATKQALEYAKEHGINLAGRHGSGKDGRIVLRDLLSGT